MLARAPHPFGQGPLAQVRRLTPASTANLHASAAARRGAGRIARRRSSKKLRGHDGSTAGSQGADRLAPLREVPADRRDDAGHADAGGHRRELVHGLRQSGEEGQPLLDRAGPQAAGQRPRRPLRLPGAGRPARRQRHGHAAAAGQPELVGLLRPGQGGRLRGLRVLAHDEPAQPQALRRPLAVGLGQVHRRMGRHQPRRRPGDQRARRVRHPALPRPRPVEERLSRAAPTSSATRRSPPRARGSPPTAGPRRSPRSTPC